MERHANYADFAGYAFGAPGEVAGFEAESAVLGVTTTGADQMNTLGANTCVGWLATLLKGPASRSILFFIIGVMIHTSSCDSMLALLR